ncbi:ATP-grasp ribosomal peptide maturase [Streptomyces albireticuli]|uniref:Alpha-L-glutamate ligase n=1 Tax=Streptomyces albireticuli TaxID=1940 RepID=A0A2A2D369_9ACTN|nr:ATP-grasp ribosomal peptide maturase [Streptomyces albireticuli]MCD9146117.1 ATP-grasp ribosomal peptide maturase [Streptomyces albireticuli]MCD9165811.1 ATP-grasp ribosomal peptide maturase [Streptomyces albireticuli]MCD9196028.1 ATP-grasp ribosomal peptide maturase [Streptomyces albireticuli]PAU46883.1 alpha-L-glutamate ligase [Streptomyces albireticuli]
MTVLVLTRPLLDGVADMVVTELTARGISVCRMDPGDFPETSTLTAEIGPGGWRGSWRGQHQDPVLEEITAVYYRRPSPFRLHPGLSHDDARWASSEARAGLGGILTSLPCIWINHPHHNAQADFAPLALATAVRCGLRVPPTLITNDPAEARTFISGLPGKTAAYKALGTTGPGSRNGEQYALWTTQVRADDITSDVARTAHLFQQWIDKQYEVRLTAVNEQMFAAEIHAGSDASRADFRRDYDSLTFRECGVPDAVRKGVRRLMEAFGLRYVALDFLVNHQAAWHLVDINPSGQYGFIPELRDPITRALADALQEGEAR